MFGNNPLESLRLKSGLRRGCSATLAIWLAAAAFAWAEPVKIEFLPPPMEGTLSLGVYDSGGKLVRVLHREADVSELTASENGLATLWDGLDERGAACPPGKYRAKGVMVGDLAVDGVDFIGNDWVTSDDSPHLSRITGLGMNSSGDLVIGAMLPGQPPTAFYFAVALKPAPTPGDEAEQQFVAQPGMPKSALPMAEGKIRGEAVTDAAAGTNGTVWLITKNTVKQHSQTGKLLRTLASQAGDPPPVKLTASPTEEKIYVLYENATLQRLRGYDFTGVKPGDEPKELFENDIRASDRFEQIASELNFPNDQPFVPSATLTVALMPNSLFHNKPGMLEINVNVDKEGSYLAATDGLPLCHISDTKFLKWAVMGRTPGSQAITVFDSDGAVVEEFEISKIANMMAFDAGIVQLPAAPLGSKAATVAPNATPISISPAPSPAVSPAKMPETSLPTPPLPVSTPTGQPAVISGS